MISERIQSMVTKRAAQHFREGHSMASRFYEIGEELGDLYVSVQQSLRQCPDCGVSPTFGYDPKTGRCHNPGCCSR